MEKVDELIDALAEHIKKRIDEGNDMENEITEKTKALAELVSARAFVFSLIVTIIFINSVNDCSEKSGYFLCSISRICILVD